MWACGIVLHELLTGRQPFQGRTSFELTSIVLAGAAAAVAILRAARPSYDTRQLLGEGSWASVSERSRMARSARGLSIGQARQGTCPACHTGRRVLATATIRGPELLRLPSPSRTSAAPVSCRPQAAIRRRLPLQGDRAAASLRISLRSDRSIDRSARNVDSVHVLSRTSTRDTCRRPMAMFATISRLTW